MSAVDDLPARILVVDDTEANRDLLVRRLHREGHAAEVACDGQEALAMLRGDSFDLVLLDIMMPGLNGYEVLRQMREDAQLRHVPVILISALGDSDSIVRGIELGADDHLPKPFNPHILRARVGASLARKRLHDREQMHARSMERELDIAREIQAGFLPDALPAADGWDLAAWFEPARRVSGDFYDAFALHGGRRIGLVVADVCGKGVGAALFMALFRSLVRALAERMPAPSAAGDTSEDAGLAAQVAQLVAGVNDYIARTHDRDHMFATLFFAVLDPASGALVYVNGGHEAPAISGRNGLRTRLAPGGPAVGMLPGMVFSAACVTIAPGETLVAFTDGITDAFKPDGSRYTEQRLLSLLAQPAGSAAASLQRIQADVQAAAAGVAPFDDITLLVVHRQP